MLKRPHLYPTGSIGSAARRARKGATAVEMALIAPVFFLLMMGITEIALILTAQQLLENAAYNTTRLASTGYTASGKTQAQTVQQVLDNELQSYGTFINVGNVTMTSTAYNSFTAAGSGTGGASGLGAEDQIVVYTVSYPWTLFTPMLNAIIGTGGVVTITSQIVVHNEPYG